MVAPFEFATVPRVVFGVGVAGQVGTVAASFGRRAFLVTGRDPMRAAAVVGRLLEAGVALRGWAVSGEPTVEMARAATAVARDDGCDLVVAVGGGSALDLGKAVAMLLANEGDPLDFLEVVGSGRPILRPSVPLVALPTTSGTGSEVTRNAVLASPGHGVKASLRSPLMFARVALVDPSLTVGLPPAVTASTGMDALTQLVEPFLSCRANPLVSALCREGIPRIARSLERAFHDGDDLAAREDLALGSLFGGLALANAGLGADHGFAAVLGGLLGAPHGTLCARLLAPTLAVNVAALRARGPDLPALAACDEVGRLLTGDPTAGADAGVAWIDSLCDRLGIPRLAALGLQPGHRATAIAGARAASSTRANPLPLTDDELGEILDRAS